MLNRDNANDRFHANFRKNIVVMFAVAIVGNLIFWGALIAGGVWLLRSLGVL